MTDHSATDDKFDDLNDLIRYLEKEQEQLKQRVEQAAEAWEFAEAKAYPKTYRSVEGRLLVLRSLRDPNYEERTRGYRS